MFNHLAHPLTDHHEKEFFPLRCKLLAAYSLLLVSGLWLHPDGEQRREDWLQSQRDACDHCHAASSQRDTPRFLRQHSTHR